MRRFVRLGVLALVVGVVWVGVREAPASARRRHRRPPPKTIQIADTASLSADRTTADVVLLVTCKGFTPASIKVSVDQNGVSGVAHSGADYKCNGTRQRLVVPVTANSGAFRTGTAIVNATVVLHSSDPNSEGVKNPSVAKGIQLV